MRRLAETDVLKSAGMAAVGMALLCLPRLTLWSNRQLPLWYLEASLFLGGFVLWAFVFAWHTKYTGRPVFTLNIDLKSFAAATAAGIAVAVVMAFFLDPGQRTRTPDAFPSSVAQWVAFTLFSLAFNQLVLIFAPLAWLLRLVKNRTAAAGLTILFDVMVLAMKAMSSPEAVPPPMRFAVVLLFRAILGVLTIVFYLRGGVLLAWWWGAVIQARHLFSLQDEA